MSLLRLLEEDWSGCTRCRLHELREDRPVLFGAGHPSPEILLVKEAPTAEEVETGVLLKSTAGELLIELLEYAKINPKEVFVTSTVGCRPYSVIPATDEDEERQQDRVPDKAELKACKPRLNEIIYFTDPRLIITMGELAWTTLVLSDARKPHKKISTAAGNIFETIIQGVTREVRYPVLATESPEKMIANPSTSKYGPIDCTCRYLEKAKEYIDTVKKGESR